MPPALFPKSLGAKHRIYAGSIQRADSGCWEWQFGCQTAGYGAVHWHGEQTTVHRLAWEMWRGPIPSDLFVLHKCDNPCCCNPMHLMLGTHADNMRDMGRKRRQWLAREKDNGKKIQAPNVPDHRRARGETVGTSKITSEMALGIYRDKRKQRDIAKDYGVSQTHVWRIKSGKSWAHITKHILSPLE